MLGKGKTTTYVEDSKTRVSTLIGEGTVFNGDITSPETVRVDGTINGNCVCERKMIIGAEGQIKGNISAESVIISGKVEGDVNVRGKIEILSTGKLIGNIVAKSLVVDEDACFDGRCTMTSSSPSSDAAQNAAKPSQTPDHAKEKENSSEQKSKKG